MTMREQVLGLVETVHGYEEIGARLGIAPGLAYLVATGLSADGSDAPSSDPGQRTGFVASSQHLANPRLAQNPTSRDRVHAWVRRRVAADAQMRAASDARRQGQGS